jgi:membrane-associated phospholipid phosphatase
MTRYVTTLAVIGAICVIAIVFVDMPLAKLLIRTGKHFPSRLEIHTAPILVAIFSVSLVFGAVSWFKRTPSRNGEVAFLVSCSALITWLINDFIFKPLFGRRTVFEPASNTISSSFSLLKGSYNSGFPSGHTAIIASVLAILWQYFPRYRRTYMMVLMMSSALLIVADLHNISDVIAGSFVGFSAGHLCVTLWRRYRVHQP